MPRESGAGRGGRRRATGCPPTLENGVEGEGVESGERTRSDGGISEPRAQSRPPLRTSRLDASCIGCAACPRACRHGIRVPPCERAQHAIHHQGVHRPGSGWGGGGGWVGCRPTPRTVRPLQPSPTHSNARFSRVASPMSSNRAMRSTYSIAAGGAPEPEAAAARAVTKSRTRVAAAAMDAGRVRAGVPSGGWEAASSSPSLTSAMATRSPVTACRGFWW